MRILLVVVTGAAIVLVGWLVAGAFFGGGAVTEDEIERAVAQRPRGPVQFVLCNEVFVPSQTPRRSSAHTWTCDTYVGRSRTDTQNGPSYRVSVDDDRIDSIRRVPTH